MNTQKILQRCLGKNSKVTAEEKFEWEHACAECGKVKKGIDRHQQGKQYCKECKNK